MILISGATGMVGRHLLAALITGQKKPVRALYRSETKRLDTLDFLADLISKTEHDCLQHIDWFKADILDIPALTEAFLGVDQVYHCAGLVSFDIRDRESLRKVNIKGTANMVNLALAQQVNKFCHLSSVAALGHEEDGKKITEKSIRNNNRVYSYYDISKYGGEMEVWRASQEGLSTVIVNPSVIIGAGNWNSGSGRLFSQVAKGFPFKVPKVSGFVAVEDVCKAMVMLMESDCQNERFILNSEMWRLVDVTQLIAQELQVKPPKIKLQKWMVYLLWVAQSIGYLFGGGKEITLDSAAVIFKSVAYDNSKIKQVLGFEFLPIKDSIIRTSKSYQREKDLR